MMIYLKESVVSYYLSRIPAENQSTFHMFGQKKCLMDSMYFSFRSLRWDSDLLSPICWIHPPGCNRGIHEGFSLGSHMETANHQGFHLRSLEAFCLGQAWNLHPMFVCLVCSQKKRQKHHVWCYINSINQSFIWKMFHAVWGETSG